MTLTNEQLRVASILRRDLGWGDRRIADELGVTRHSVRRAREEGLEAEDPLNEEEVYETRNSNGYKHVVVIPDTQWPFQDDPSERALQEYIHKTQPDELLHIGDAADFYSLARFLKTLPPSERIYLQEEVDVVRSKFKEYANLVPDARKRITKGNHDERLDRYLETNGAELFDLVNGILSYDHVSGAAESGWEVIGPYGEGCWVGEPGGLWATHGDYARKWSAMTPKAHVMEKYGHSVIHGHTHRLGQFFHTRQTAYGPETVVGIECGTLASMQTTPRSAKVVDWQYGFADVWVSNTSPRFHVSLVAIIDGSFVLGGSKYGI